MGIRQLANGRWRVQIRRKMLQIDEVCDTREKADQIYRQALGQVVNDPRLLTIGQLWEKYENSSVFDAKSLHTQKTERCRIRPVLAALGQCPLAQFENDRGQIHDFMDARAKAISSRTGKKLSKATQRLELAALAAVVNFGVARKLLRENFLAQISRPVSSPRTRRVAPIEQGKLRIVASGSGPLSQAARFLLLVRHLGCRPGELMKLTVDQVRLDRRDITFLGTKNGLNRIVHVTGTASEFLEIQLTQIDDSSPYLFGSWSHQKREWVPYNYSHGVNLLREKKIVGRDYHAHAGRREFISHGIEEGTELMVIKKQTGHKSVQALEMYDQAASTAPKIRRKLDDLAASLEEDTLKYALEAISRTDEDRRRLRELLGEPKNKWINPFPD